MVAFSRYPEHILEICDSVLRLLAASVVHSVTLDEGGCLEEFLISAPSLAHLTEQWQTLKSLKLIHLTLDENHCRVLGDYSRPGLEIDPEYCRLTNAGTSPLAKVLGRNQGPTILLVVMTIPLSQMGYAETVVSRASDHAFSATVRSVNENSFQLWAPFEKTKASLN
jgi:hypothetical protein